MKGSDFKELHLHIMNKQVWLHGIHHVSSKEQLHGYLDELHCDTIVGQIEGQYSI